MEFDLTDIVTAMRKVDANHEPSEANDLLTVAVTEIERLRRAALCIEWAQRRGNPSPDAGKQNRKDVSQ